VNPADAPIMIIALTSDKFAAVGTVRCRIDHSRAEAFADRWSRTGAGRRQFGSGGADQCKPDSVERVWVGIGECSRGDRGAKRQRGEGEPVEFRRKLAVSANDQLMKRRIFAPHRFLQQWPAGTAVERRRRRGLGSNHPLHGARDGKRAALLIILSAARRHIITTVDAIKAALPQLHASIDPTIEMSIGLDQTQTIRASVSDIERTLLISVALVVLSCSCFCGNSRHVDPAHRRTHSIIGTLAAMYLFGYSIDHTSR